jgi:hypothetical protein
LPDFRPLRARETEAASPIGAPSHGIGDRLELVAAILPNETGGKPGICFKAGSNVRAGFYLAQKLIDRARAEFMKRSGEAT